ncbi:MAG: hypothetical protein KA371_04210 [Acidobacteria bacterium]|nr:hypothetical protein [Acidobacteriota bacterium]
MRPASQPLTICRQKAVIGLLKASPALIILLILTLAPTALAACTPAPRPHDAASAPTGPDGQEAVTTLRIGESFTAPGTRTVVTVENVSDDSRCPADADCVWAGDATVTLRVQPAAGPAEHLALHVSDASSHSATAGGLRLRLVRLDPEPRAGQSINREQYVVAISVTK